jgi:hypothetical protein
MQSITPALRLAGATIGRRTPALKTAKKSQPAIFSETSHAPSLV